MDQALATWPGVQQIMSFNGTFQHGRTPCAFRLTIAPQRQIVKGVGTLTLSYGRTRIQFVDCVVDQASYQFDAGGYLVGLLILDRRWKWRMPTISGRYNQTDDAGNLIDSNGVNAVDSTLINSKRTPQQLAKLLLNAMGEQGYDVSELPNDVFPRIDWSVTNASHALADLCEQLGCRIVLGLDNKVRIKKLGQGKPLPNLPFIDAQLDIDPAEKPSSIRVYTAPILFQADFELEAVGLETDGTIKLIDQLSYKPAAGWGAGDARFMSRITNVEHRKLALLSVFRWYRIKTPAKVTIPVTNEAVKIQDRRQIVLDGSQVETDTEGDRKRRRDAWVFGVFFPGHWSNGVSSIVTASDGNSAASVTPITSNKVASYLPASFEIDDENKMVRFSEPVYKLAPSTGTLAAATIRLRTSYRLRNYKTGDFYRAYQSRAVKDATAKTAPMSIVHDDIEPTSRQKYTQAYAANGVSENATDVQKQLKYYLDSAVAELGVDDPSSKKYPTLIAQELDGALHSITWEITPNGSFTTIQRNQDRAMPGAIPYAMKRQAERVKFQQEQGKAVADFVERAARAAAPGKRKRA